MSWAKHIPLGLAAFLFLTFEFLRSQAPTFPFDDLRSKSWFHSETAADLGYAYGHFCYDRLESLQAGLGLTVDYQHLLKLRLLAAMLVIAIFFSTSVWVFGTLVAAGIRKYLAGRRAQPDPVAN